MDTVPSQEDLDRLDRLISERKRREYGEEVEKGLYDLPEGAGWRRVYGSSCVLQIAWWPGEEKGGVLAVTFKPKPYGHKKGVARVWWYEGVPRRVYDEMLSASSRGQFVWTDLRDRYDSYEVEGTRIHD